ncbi:MAG: 50S ribosomal protein L18 [Candidatus Liptonbacteria bacterium]|nr:50S ribosomal protein L18 [Candidatus Liptonbacteria bacterium]
MKQKLLFERKLRRAKRTRAKIFGTATRPRLSVFRSNKAMYVQLIDDEAGKTLASVSSRGISKIKSTKTAFAALVGQEVAKKAEKLGIKEAIFDRGAYRYHGRVKALAEALREVGFKI